MRCLVLLLALTLGLVLPAPAQTESTSVRVGVVCNLSGPEMRADIGQVEGALLAVTRINRRGGLQGLPLEFVVRDLHSDAQALLPNLLGLVNDPTLLGVVALVSDPMDARVGQQAGAHKRFVLGPCLTEVATPPVRYLQTQACTDSVLGAAAAEFAHQRGWRTARLEGSPGVRAAAFASRFADLGGRLVEQDPEVVYLSGGGPGALSQLRQQGVSGWVIYADQDLTEVTLADARAIHACQVDLSSENREAREFLEAYRRAYPLSRPVPEAALAYDSLLRLADAVDWARCLDSDSVAHALAERAYSGVTGEWVSRRGVPVKTVYFFGFSEGGRHLVDSILLDDPPTSEH